MKTIQILLLLGAVSYATCGIAQQADDAPRYDTPFDVGAMAQARAALKSGHGAQINSLILAERLEYHSNDGEPLMVLEGQGWVGGDLRKLWLKTEGEYATEHNRLEEFELQALYSRAVSPFWDLQMGLRQDIRPQPARTYAVIGAQGLAPYWFELDAAVFLSDQGDVSARLEAEYEIHLSQRLKLQPRLELNAALTADEDIAVGSGLSTVAAGLRLRYEITREFAPYVGVSWSQSFAETRDYRRLQGERTRQVSLVAGLRLWF